MKKELLVGLTLKYESQALGISCFPAKRKDPNYKVFRQELTTEKVNRETKEKRKAKSLESMTQIGKFRGRNLFLRRVEM